MRARMTPRKIMIAGVTVLIALSAVELAGYLTSLYFASKGALYKPQSEVGFETYAAARHPVLGWVRRPNDGTDAVGSRPVPADTDTRSPCVSLYGDSFTWASEVDARNAWGNHLTAMLNCRVHNFGVPGYGSDQAYLRFLHNDLDTARIVVLVHLSENILRNANRYRWLLYPGGAFQFKPRFLAKDGTKLHYVPPLLPSRAQFRRLIAAPEKFLENDAFVPGGMAGVARFGFPFSLAVARSLGHISVRSKITGKPWFMNFYDPRHQAGALRVTRNILVNFGRDARRQNRHPVVAIMPTGLDLTYFGKHRKWPFQPLLDELSGRNFPVINIGNGIMKRLAGEDPCHLFDDCSGHFNERGYAIVARVMQAPLRSLIAVAERPGGQ